MTPTVGSLFSGIGGFDLGFERAGFDVRWQCEIEQFARRVLAHHWPGVPCYEDVTKLKGNEIEPVDVICFGSPCQDLSCAGKRAGIVDGGKSSLFWEAVRIMGEMAAATGGVLPRVAVWENVYGALSSNGGRDFELAISALARVEVAGRRLFDRVEWRVLRTGADFGYPHQRKRVFVLAYAASAEHKRQRKAASTRKERIDCHHGRELADAPRRGFGIVRQSSGGNGQPDGRGADVANPFGPNEPGRKSASGEARGGRTHGQLGGSGGILADASEQGSPMPRPCGIIGGATRDGARATAERDCPPLAPPGPGDRAAWAAILEEFPEVAPAIESSFCGMVDGVPVWLDRAYPGAYAETPYGPLLPIDIDRRPRLKALGNAIVPAAAQWVAERVRSIL